MDREAFAEELESLGQYEQADRWRRCHRHGDGYVAFCPDSPEHFHKFVPLSCNIRVCPLCAGERASAIAARYVGKATRLGLVDGQRHSFRHLVLTARRDESASLPEQMDKLFKSAHKLFKKLWPSRRDGAVASFEIGPSGSPHLHLLVYGGYRAQRAISKLWQELTGNSVVWISVVDGVGGVHEVLKYLSKGLGKLSVEEAVELYLGFRGKRRVRAWGVFHGLKVDGEFRSVCPVCGVRLKLIPEAEWLRDYQPLVLAAKVDAAVRAPP